MMESSVSPIAGKSVTKSMLTSCHLTSGKVRDWRLPFFNVWSVFYVILPTVPIVIYVSTAKRQRRPESRWVLQDGWLGFSNWKVVSSLRYQHANNVQVYSQALALSDILFFPGLTLWLAVNGTKLNVRFSWLDELKWYTSRLSEDLRFRCGGEFAEKPSEALEPRVEHPTALFDSDWTYHL